MSNNLPCSGWKRIEDEEEGGEEEEEDVEVRVRR